MTDLATAWSRFDAAAEAAKTARLVALFDREPGRLDRLSLDAAGLFLDLSKQAWTGEGVDAALALARAAEVERRRDALFAGDVANPSEGRAVLHPALRAPDGAGFLAQGAPVSGEVERVRDRMRAFSEAIRSGALRGATSERFRTVLHIGIGGSDLGPRLIWEALKPLDPEIDLRFVANVDGAELVQALVGLDPATTLLVVVSKTFTTQETLSNANAARAWLAATLGEEGANRHLAAVSTALDKTAAFGVDPDRVFGFWDWVGGRYSLWSAVGLSCAVALGWERFAGFLAGGAAMDDHFRTAPLDRNAPVLLGLAQLFNRTMGRSARAVIPYAQRLRLLPDFLQQLEMESNGKRVGPDGKPVARPTCPVVFGDAGTNGQHAFFQQLHQGTDVVPLEFVLLARSDDGPADAHFKLLANGIAQAEALLVGRDEGEVRVELEARGLGSDAIDVLAPQRAFSGNRPSSTILLDRLTPERLGALIALYEHKTAVEGWLYGVNSFDQWGVELGKTLAARILPELTEGAENRHDPSTTSLIRRLRA